MNDEIGWSFVALKNGEEVVSRHEGFSDRHRNLPWTEQTIVPVWSATKGPMAASVLMALHRVGLDGESLVDRVWPELGRSDLSFEELFSHQGGYAGLNHKVPIWDHRAVVSSLEIQKPLWEVGTHGYHPRTIGFLADEIVRRIDGRSLGEFWWEEIASPEGIDFWIGLPESEFDRVAELVPARASKGGEPKAFYEALLAKDSLTRLAFSSPSNLSGVSEMNQSRAWQAGFPAMGGVGSARGLAQFYDWLLRQEFLAELIRPRIKGLDVIQRIENSFGFGVMLGLGPEKDCFGHPGAGGSYGFANPENGMSYAFVMNNFEASLFPSAERLALVTEAAGAI